MVGDNIKGVYGYDEIEFTKKYIRINAETIIKYSNIKHVWYTEKSFWNYFTWWLLGTDFPGLLTIELYEKVQKRKIYIVKISNLEFKKIAKTYLNDFHIFF